MRLANIVAAILGIAIGAWAIYEGTGFPEDYVMKVGPSYFPNLMAGGLILCSLIGLWQAASTRKDSPDAHAQIAERASGRDFTRVAIACVAALLFCWLFKPLGFILTSALFIAGLMFLLGKRAPILFALVPLSASAAIYILFDRLLALQLPQGLLAGLF